MGRVTSFYHFYIVGQKIKWLVITDNFHVSSKTKTMQEKLLLNVTKKQKKTQVL